VEERQEAAINGRRSQNSERVRAHLYERGFRQEPDRRVLVGEVDRGLTSRHRRRAPQGHGRRSVPPDDSDMHLGRERPPKTRLGTVIGGWQRGSLTPHMAASLLLTAAPTGKRAAQSAARCGTAKSFNAKHIDGSRSRGRRLTAEHVATRVALLRRGTTAPVSVVPPPFLRLRLLLADPGGEKAAAISADRLARSRVREHRTRTRAHV
jgi:hypothetical protein